MVLVGIVTDEGRFLDANDMEAIGLWNIRTFVFRKELPDLSHFLINFYDAEQQPDTENPTEKCNLTVATHKTIKKWNTIRNPMSKKKL